MKNMYLNNMVKVHGINARVRVCEVRVGGEEIFEPFCATKMATC